MKTEEILRREREYRAVREALGTYHVDVVVGMPTPLRHPPAGVVTLSGDSPSGPPEAGESHLCLVAPSRYESPDAVESDPPGAIVSH